MRKLSKRKKCVAVLSVLLILQRCRSRMDELQSPLWWLRREEQGAYSSSCQELEEADEPLYSNFARFFPEQFYELEKLVSQKIQRQNTDLLSPQSRIRPWSIILGGHVIAQVTWTIRDALRLAKRTGQKINTVGCVALRCGGGPHWHDYMQLYAMQLSMFNRSDGIRRDRCWLNRNCRSVHVAATTPEKQSLVA